MKVNKRSFKTIDGLELIIMHRKSAVIFEIGQSYKENNSNILLRFDTETFKELLEHIETVSNKSWVNISPKECGSLGADYFEYYDKEFDSNGYLKIRNNELSIEKPSLQSNKLYQFNKRRMESFIYDFRKLIKI